MRFSELTILLPCHSLEDFPVFHRGAEADQLLAAWSALWHPALVACAAVLPTWQRIDLPPETLANRLLMIPPFTADRVPGGFIARAKNEGALVVQETSREAAVAAALAALDDDLRAQVDPSLAADFLALGFCRLQIELLTRQMRYSMQIDETHFQNEVLAGAHSAVAGDEADARRHLQACFEALYDARKHYYPVDVHLLDVTLLAATTLGRSLERELAAVGPANLLAPTSIWRHLQGAAPELWSRLLASVDQGTACLLGNEIEERELPLLPLETTLDSLRAGVTDYEALVGRRPQVFARRRAGLWPALPAMLVKLGYQGALHFTLDDGRFPLAPQSKTRWEGLDTSVLDVFGRVPCDAAKADTFLGLSRTMADAMDHDHVATIAFAHWPDAVSPWYRDLRRIAELSPVLGKFMLCDDYFSHTDMPGRLSKFEPDEYRAPYLAQAIIAKGADPIGRFVGIYREQAAAAAANTLGALADLVQGSSTCLDQPATVETGLSRLADLLVRSGEPAAPRGLIANPLSFARKIGVELPAWDQSPAESGSVLRAGESGGRRFAVVEVPAMGFAWIDPAGASAAPSRQKSLAQDNVLRNEFFEVTVGRATGGIQSIYSFAQRGNLLSQQIAFRLANPPGIARTGSAEEALYTTMQADSVEITASSSACGEITSAGSLLAPGGGRVAGFRQITRVWAGSRVIHVDIELIDAEPPRADPWNSYYAARFAWSDESAELYRGIGLTRHKTSAARLEAPEYIDIETAGGTLTILTGGLPYHCRGGARMLDSLLAVQGETTRRFSLALGVELAHPAAAAMEWITPATNLFATLPPPRAASGWFFHVDAKNVVATHWEPLLEEPSAQASGAGAGARVKGFRARLLETAGRAGRVTLRTFRPVAQARQIDFLGGTLLTAAADNDKIKLDFSAFEWVEVEAIWSHS
ncbi:MAG TPA: hypothetical protein VHV08_15170 [Pirellulales bacterium]|nr:hypothetical protein [Pirellulales bacterium]